MSHQDILASHAYRSSYIIHAEIDETQKVIYLSMGPAYVTGSSRRLHYRLKNKPEYVSATKQRNIRMHPDVPW